MILGETQFGVNGPDGFLNPTFTMSTAIQEAKEPEIRTNGWGIDLNYKDALGKWHETPRETITALLQAMEADGDSISPSQNETVIVIRSGEQCD